MASGSSGEGQPRYEAPQRDYAKLLSDMLSKSSEEDTGIGLTLLSQMAARDSQKQLEGEMRGNPIPVGERMNRTTMRLFRGAQSAAAKSGGKYVLGVTSLDNVSIGNVCVEKDISKLRRLKISELKAFTVHYGCYLDATIAVDGAQLSGFQTVVRDDDNHLLAVSLYGISSKYTRKLTVGTRVLIKQPWLKVSLTNGEMLYGLRDDNAVYNIEVIDDCEPGANAEEMKAKGNAQMGKDDIEGAALSYRLALDIQSHAETAAAEGERDAAEVAEMSRELKIRTNLVLALTKLREFGDALTESMDAFDLAHCLSAFDATEASGKLIEKVYFRHVTALRNTCHFKEALQVLESVRKGLCGQTPGKNMALATAVCGEEGHPHSKEKEGSVKRAPAKKRGPKPRRPKKGKPKKGKGKKKGKKGRIYIPPAAASSSKKRSSKPVAVPKAKATVKKKTVKKWHTKHFTKQFMELETEVLVKLKEATYDFATPKEWFAHCEITGEGRVGMANFYHPSIEVRFISDAIGCGIFATADILKYTNVIIERPIEIGVSDASRTKSSTVTMNMDANYALQPHDSDMIAKVRYRLYEMPSHERYRLGLLPFDDDSVAASRAHSRYRTQLPSVDAFRYDQLPEGICADDIQPISAKRIIGIVQKCPFKLPATAVSQQSYSGSCALYPLSAFVTDSPAENCNWVAKHGFMAIGTERGVRKGEQLTIKWGLTT